MVVVDIKTEIVYIDKAPFLCVILLSFFEKLAYLRLAFFISWIDLIDSIVLPTLHLSDEKL